MSVFLKILFPTLILIPSCEKEVVLPCYECISTIITTTDPVLSGYPDTSETTKEICDMTQDQIQVYEDEYGGSISTVVPTEIHPQGILFQFIFSRKCSRQ